MDRLRQLPRLRIAADGIAIGVSILPAFAIAAWWQRQSQAEHAGGLAGEVRPGRIFDFDSTPDRFLDHAESSQYAETRLRARSDIEARLGERIVHSTFVVRGLADIEATQAQIIEKLAAINKGDQTWISNCSPPYF